MKLVKAFFALLPLKTWLIGLLIVLLLLGFLGWRAGCKAAETAKDQTTIVGARSDSATDAIGTIGEVGAANEQTRGQVKDDQNDIRAETDAARRDALATERVRCLQRAAGPC